MLESLFQDEAGIIKNEAALKQPRYAIANKLIADLVLGLLIIQ